MLWEGWIGHLRLLLNAITDIVTVGGAHRLAAILFDNASMLQHSRKTQAV